jgi:PBP1b-binding outer membrane lipoprotein LpoB
MREKKHTLMLVGCLLLALLITGCTSSETEGSRETEDLEQVAEVQTDGEVTIAEKNIG